MFVSASHYYDWIESKISFDDFLLPSEALLMFVLLTLPLVILIYGCRVKICRLGVLTLALLYILADLLSTLGVVFGETTLSVNDSVSSNSTSDLDSLYLDLITTDEFLDAVLIKVVLVLFALNARCCKGVNIFMVVILLTGLFEVVFSTSYLYSIILDGDLSTCKRHLLNETYSNNG